jgi:hypothetical protein
VPTVYLETTVPSYLVARPSRDLIVAAHQQITQEWWATAFERFDMYVSDAVIDEMAVGNVDYSARRLELVSELGVLAFTVDVENLIHSYHERLGLVGSATADLPHFAYAVAYEMDYLVTWNCKHIANGQVIRRLNQINSELQRHTPVIVTPEELLEFFPGDE